MHEHMHKHAQAMHKQCTGTDMLTTYNTYVHACSDRAGLRELDRRGDRGGVSHWRDCHSADALSPSLLKQLPKTEGGAAE